MPRFVKRKLSKKEQKAALKTPVQNFDISEKKNEQLTKIEKRKVYIPSVILVKDFADRANLPVTVVISQLMRSGVLANLNETIDFDTAEIIGDDLNLEVLHEEQTKHSKDDRDISRDSSKNLTSRPPVVTIMGHVDHGKTTLLDKIREAKVAESESGGITQHISAYQVTLGETKKNLRNRTITFIDTPGHAAFSAMREHGALITDIIVLIIAANDGVMPQTIEVIEKAKENNVPIIVAINKVDLPDADVMRAKQQLAEYELVPEEWGGKTVMVEVSAKTGKGIDDLLEMILLQTDIMDLVADEDVKATGTVIESYMTKGSGAMAMILIENGSLHKGEPIAIGNSYGKVRVLENFTGRQLEVAKPSMPVKIAGLKSLPNFGDRLQAFTSEKEARENAFKAFSYAPKVNIATAKKVESKEGGELKKQELNIVLKSDVAGSIEAIKKMINEFDSAEAGVKIISEGVGTISESDVTLAEATNAVVVGFRVKILGAAKKIADKDGIEIETHEIIYELINSLKAKLSLLLPPLVEEEELGTGKILAIFRDDKKGFVTGGIIESGRLAQGDEIKFFQNTSEKYRDKIISLRKEKSEVKECASGSECGFALSAGANIAVGDKFIAFKRVEKKRTIE